MCESSVRQQAQGRSARGALLHGLRSRSGSEPEAAASIPTTKPRALAPGVCLLSRGACPWGRGAAARSVDRQIRVSSVVGGAAGAGTWGQVSIGTFRWVRGTWDGAVDGDGLTRQERQGSVESWSRGRIVSALLMSAPGGCLPSVEPPNPDAATMGRLTGASNGRSGFDTALHRGQRRFMKGLHPSFPCRSWLLLRRRGMPKLSPACWRQPLLQVQPQSQEPPVLQVQSAVQPQPQGQGQSSTSAWG
jgi:hypothetical protein